MPIGMRTATNKVELESSMIASRFTGFLIFSFFTLVAMAFSIPNDCRAEETESLKGKSRPIPSVEDKSKKYQWLFKGKVEERTAEPTPLPVFDTMDKEIKEARRLYLAGEIHPAIEKYNSVIKLLQSTIDDLPSSNPILVELESRFAVFDEFITKIIGPLNLDTKPESTSLIFDIMESRRHCRRNLIFKKAGIIPFYDVPANLLNEEFELQGKLFESIFEPHQKTNGDVQKNPRDSLLAVRESLLKSSKRYSAFIRPEKTSLSVFQKELSAKEIVLDYTLLPDRIIVGIISAENAGYYQIPANRTEIDRSVLHLQEKLRDLSVGGEASFMGHAWKEPCRRIYRFLFSKVPVISPEKSVVHVIPDRSLWYLPFPALLDSEDKPFGRDRLVNLIGSIEMLRFGRKFSGSSLGSGSTGDMLVLESVPWIAEEDLKETSEHKKAAHEFHESEIIERLILTNPVYPKASEFVSALQKSIKKPSIFVGPAATSDRILEYKDQIGDVGLIALPLSMTDLVTPDRQPALYFSQDKKGARKADIKELAGVTLKTPVLIFPTAWMEMRDVESIAGEGPLLLQCVLIYSGTQSVLINYAEPNWGGEETFLSGILKRIMDKTGVLAAISGSPKEIPAVIDPALSGRPPSWVGWILMGDPSRS